MILNKKHMQQIQENDDFTADERTDGDQHRCFCIKVKELIQKNKQQQLDQLPHQAGVGNFPHLVLPHKKSAGNR
ncbi:Uncharacterised protein [Mycobacteroides abscessus subsp. abscessus]|nr:Uncharacterised protein [Mycobacteroides abscessus subsp. abscessus]